MSYFFKNLPEFAMTKTLILLSFLAILVLVDTKPTPARIDLWPYRVMEYFTKLGDNSIRKLPDSSNSETVRTHLLTSRSVDHKTFTFGLKMYA